MAERCLEMGAGTPELPPALPVPETYTLSTPSSTLGEGKWGMTHLGRNVYDNFEMDLQ